MGKWLAVAGIALLAVMFLLWKQLDSTDATAAPQPTQPDVVASTASRATPSSTTPAAKPTEVVAAAEPAATEAPKKMDVLSDAFFYKFQEVVPAVLSRNAAKCYEGVSKRVHRNQKLVLKFKVKIKNGEVTINDVKADVNTLDNAGLESCFIQEVQRTTWRDDELPDWEAEDELVIRPERGLKKYSRENIEYVGQPAPKD
ncbi:MAG: hypothetical protein JWP01_3898 [Myxococcales bacterium]|nr:hypothetical protein [Myxococcales bacterium]